jgi:ribokinase
MSQGTDEPHAPSSRPLRLAVIGHVEWVTHARAPFYPRPGDIVHLEDPFEQPGGGGAVSAAALARMGAEVTLFTALGCDGRSRAPLERLGLRIEAAERDAPQTPALAFTDPRRDRTILVVGERLFPTADDPLPWKRLAEMDGVYFTGDDPRTLRLARAAPVLVVTARRFDALVASGVRADALIGSRTDPGEQFDLARLSVQPRHVVVTDGARGGTGYTAVPAPGPVVDTYGAGDTFLAGVLFGLSAREPLAEALARGAREAAAAVTWRGAYPEPGDERSC